MIAVDTDILVYYHRLDSPYQVKARVAIDRLMKSNRPWAIPWPCVSEFLVTVSPRRPYSPPSTMEQCFKALDRWRRSSELRFIGEVPGFYEKFRELASDQNPEGPEVENIRIAAICINHGVTEFWSADRDFSTFTDIKSTNPLIIPNRTADYNEL